MNKIFSLLLAVVLTGCTAVGTSKYYVDATNGDDANSGKSPDNAWRTLSKVNSSSFRIGDTIAFRRDAVFQGELDIQQPSLVVCGYGDGVQKPRIISSDSSLYAVRIYNTQNITLQDLDISCSGKEDLVRRAGVRVELKDYGVAKNINLRNLDIHDIKGSLLKSKGGGAGIFIFNSGDSITSYYDSLLIESCTIRRTHRNAIIFEGYYDRQNWHPSLNVRVVGNLIEECPGDGIVPWGCDGAVVEYNVMRNCDATLPDGEAAAGIWPWSCDNTIIRFNEAANHHAPWDGQGFDSDYNCNNTTIEYNYSHDNDGGFILICNAGNQVPPQMVGNNGTLVRYNFSVNDGIRQRPTHVGVFSPTIHIAGPTDSTLVENNLFIVPTKVCEKTDRTIIHSNSWDGFASRTFFRNNLFVVAQPSRILLTESTDNVFENNMFQGDVKSDLKSGTDKSVTIENVEQRVSNVLVDNPYVKGGKMVDSVAINKLFVELQQSYQ